QLDRERRPVRRAGGAEQAQPVGVGEDLLLGLAEPPAGGERDRVAGAEVVRAGQAWLGGGEGRGDAGGQQREPREDDDARGGHGRTTSSQSAVSPQSDLASSGRTVLTSVVSGTGRSTSGPSRRFAPRSPGPRPAGGRTIATACAPAASSTSPTRSQPPRGL